MCLHQLVAGRLVVQDIVLVALSVVVTCCAGEENGHGGIRLAAEQPGMTLLEREFKRNRKSMPDETALREVAEAFGMDSAGKLVQGVGRGNISALQVYHRVHPPEDKKSGLIDTAQKLTQLATRLGVDRSYVARILRLPLLAPDIIEAILEGREPSGLSLARLTRKFPLVWEDQRRRFGFVPST